MNEILKIYYQVFIFIVCITLFVLVFFLPVILFELFLGEYVWVYITSSLITLLITMPFGLLAIKKILDRAYDKLEKWDFNSL